MGPQSMLKIKNNICNAVLIFDFVLKFIVNVFRNTIYLTR